MRVKYLYIIEQGKNNYSAYVPDLPGCAAAGKTKAETEKLIKEAIDTTDIKDEIHNVADKLEIADKLELVKLRSWLVKFFIVCAAFSTVGFIGISLVTNSASQSDGFSFVNMIGDLRKVLEAIFGG